MILCCKAAMYSFGVVGSCSRARCSQACSVMSASRGRSSHVTCAAIVVRLTSFWSASVGGAFLLIAHMFACKRSAAIQIRLLSLVTTEPDTSSDGGGKLAGGLLLWLQAPPETCRRDLCPRAQSSLQSLHPGFRTVR